MKEEGRDGWRKERNETKKERKRKESLVGLHRNRTFAILVFNRI